MTLGNVVSADDRAMNLLELAQQGRIDDRANAPAHFRQTETADGRIMVEWVY